jgi:hypothetical protein
MLESIIMQIIVFIVGVLASFLAAHLFEARQVRRAAKPLRSLNGYWFEYVPTSKGRNYSIGKVQFQKTTRSLAFDGANYSNDGRLFCTWDSINVHVDLSTRKLFYIFRACLKDARHSENYGFGVVNISEGKDGKPKPESGHYIEAKGDARPHSHTMVALDEIIAKLGLSQRAEESTEDFHSRIVKAYDVSVLNPQRTI